MENLKTLEQRFNEKIDFFNKKNNTLLGINTTYESTTTPQPHKEINDMIVAKIREKYDINEEFKMVNLGISNPEDEQYITYRNYVQECIDWGNELELKTE